MTYKIENLSRQAILILLNNNSLVTLEPAETVAPFPDVEILDNFVVQQLQAWGFIAIRQIETARLPELTFV